jgi:predicted ATPase
MHSVHCKVILEVRSPEVCPTQPELLAYHYTEAALPAQTIPYWQRAGQRAVEHSANLETVAHLRKGLELLATLPGTPERAQQELLFQTALGPALIATQSFAAPDVEQAYTRARALCQQVGKNARLFPVLWALWVFFHVRGASQTARKQGFALRVTKAMITRGWALAKQGQAVEGAALIRQGLVVEQATGAAKSRPYFLAMLAEVYAMRGEAEAGLRALADAMEAVQSTGERHHEAELYRLQGDLLLAHTGEDHREAEACFQQALRSPVANRTSHWSCGTR